MKRILIIVLLAFTTFANAQRPNKEKIKALKIAHITERVALSTKEAQAFWPVYNTYEDNMESLRRQERKLLGNLKSNFEQLTEAESEAALNKLSKFSKDKLNKKERLITELKGIISSKKILTLLKAEEDFKRDLLRKLKERRRDFGGRPNGGM
ncbi:sensor of ECF-type sigma factor [uncultured Dokdonia sp.]|uniref:sensor of ECF-type sigma factor n=1 Tax=uncultured Dokdonia sp. TaxID=575653 RepID=UPI002636B959|nr:sensor of ECF-type sigma factor [uncultured Dokdonia sp.]